MSKTGPATGPVPHQFGDATVIVDHNTTHRPHGTREFNFRIKRADIVTAYRVDVALEDVDGLSQRELAEYLLNHVRYRSRSKLFHYRESE